jgi:hypothetical protein
MMRPGTILATALLLLLAGGPLVGSVMGQPHGEVTRVDGETLYVELDDSIAVDAGTVGRVVQEREVNDELVELTFAVLSVQEVQQPADGAWVVVCQITRQSRNLQAGDPVRFDSVDPRARFTVQSTPSEATVYLDGTRVGTTPLEGPIGQGYHKVRLEREGYRSQTRTFVAEAGERYRFRDTLETAIGTITVNSLPDSATVSLGGETLGTTPLSTEVQEDTYVLRVRRSGYLPYEDTVSVEGGDERQVNAPLRRPLQVSLADEQVKEVTNATLQREGDRLVLTYDLIGDAEAYTVELLLSTDGGKTFGPLPETVAGAVGNEVTPGENKQVVWAAVEDFPRGVTGAGNRLRLSVESGGGNGLYWVVGSVLTAGAGTAAAVLLDLVGGGGGGGGNDLPDAPPPAPN